MPTKTRSKSKTSLFHFATEIVDRDFPNFMVSLDIDSFFTNSLPEGKIEICTNERYKNNGIVHE